MSESTPTVLVDHRVPPATTDDLCAALDGRLPDGALVRADTPAETTRLLPDADGLLTFRMPDLSAADSLRWVGALSAGVGGYDTDALADAGVVLTNASGVHAEPIAEQVLAYMLAFERGLVQGIRQQTEGVWLRWHGTEIREQTLGVVGLGAIGSRVAELGAALGMDVVGTKAAPDDPPAADCEVDVFGPGGLHEVCLRADHLVVACPLTDETEGLVDADALRALGRDGVLVNVARGGVVEQDTLVRYLQGDLLRGAALDVFEEEPLPPESPLWDLPNVVVTPHQSGTTPHWPDRMADIAVANYAALRGAGEWENRVV